MITARVLIPALAVIGGHRAWWPTRLPAPRATAPTPIEPRHADAEPDRPANDPLAA
jgi:hypothetical protein